MAFLTRDQILAADDMPTREVAVPEWGGTVRVRTMSARDRDALELAALQAREDNTSVDNIRARFAAACIIDDKGGQLFGLGDIEALGNKSAAALNRVYEAIAELNLIRPDDIEDAAKN